MSKLSEEVKKEFTDKYLQILGSLGMNPTIVQVYLTIFLSTKPIGLKEIAEKTGYSVSTVCHTLEILERMIDVRKFKEPGSKKMYYECQHDLLLVQQKKFRESHTQMHAVGGLFREAAEKLEGEDDPEAVKLRGYMTKASKDMEKFDAIVHELNKMMINNQ